MSQDSSFLNEQQQNSNNKNSSKIRIDGGGYHSPKFNPKDPKKDKDKNKDKESDKPFGEYKEAEYHHENSKGGKSPCPRDGQRALNNSIEVKNSDQRIAIEDDAFVVLKKTGTRLYHGYKVEWPALSEKVQRALRRAGIVNHRGKILRR